jgi:K+-sensing histidine kinase KdpD
MEQLVLVLVYRLLVVVKDQNWVQVVLLAAQAVVVAVMHFHLAVQEILLPLVLLKVILAEQVLVLVVMQTVAVAVAVLAQAVKIHLHLLLQQAEQTVVMVQHLQYLVLR